MHTFTATTFLLAACTLLADESRAQKAEAPPPPRVDVDPASPDSTWTDRLWRFHLLPDVFRGRALHPDSARLPADDLEAALEAAGVDPGIVVFPDTSVQAEIRRIRPQGGVDPEMVVPRPRERGRNREQ